jgi:hypothetical protein
MLSFQQNGRSRAVLSKYFLPLLLLVLLSAGSSRAQAPVYGVLFETFTNSFDLCPQPNAFDADFKSTLSSKGSEVIHLNHHIANIGDTMAQNAFGSNQTMFYLSKVNGTSPIFVSAVNRTIYSSGSLPRLSPTSSEWDPQIDAQSHIARSVDFNLVSATLDKTTRTLQVVLDVTSKSAITSTAKIRYAILQDNITNVQCSGSGPNKHNNVVRYITFGDSIVGLTGKPAGTTVRMLYTQIIRNDVRFKYADMKLVAFIEESTNADDYHVTTTALLKKDFDTLQTPPHSLIVQDSALDGHTFVPGTTVTIVISKSNINFVQVAYSIDNGANWRPVALTSSLSYNWTVPDSATTQGKIKLSEVGGSGTAVAIEKGNFTIAKSAHSLTILKPTAKDSIPIGQPVKIVWTKQGFSSVMILYARDFSGKWDTISQSFGTDTAYTWTAVGPATTQAQIRLIPIGVSDVPAQTSDLFTILTSQGVAQTLNAKSSALTIYPNPATSASDLHVSFMLNEPGVVSVAVYDLLGRVVQSAMPHEYSDGVVETSLNAMSLPAGSYIVRVSTQKGFVASERFEVVK